MNNNRRSILRSRWLQTSAGLCTAVLLYLFISNIDLLLSGMGSVSRFVSPVVTGMIMAYVMNPLSNLLEDRVFNKVPKEKTRHQLSVLFTVVIVLLVLGMLMMVMIPQIVRSATYLVGHIGVYSAQLQGLVNRIAGQLAARNNQIETITSIFNEILQKITSSIIGNYDSWVETSMSIGRQVANFVIAFILAIYFLLDKEKLISGFKRLLHAVMKESVYTVSMDFLGRCHRILVRYIAVDLIDALMVGIVNYIFMKCTGIPYAGLISIIVGATNLAPTFGPIIGCAIGAFILLLINPVQALIFVIFTIILQTFDGYIFKPKVFGETFGVSPIWILIFIIVGGRMFGVMGILLAIPLAAIVNFIYDEMIIAPLERRKEKKQSDGTEESGNMMQSIKNGIRDISGTERFDTPEGTGEESDS